MAQRVKDLVLITDVALVPSLVPAQEFLHAAGMGWPKKKKKKKKKREREREKKKKKKKPKKTKKKLE